MADRIEVVRADITTLAVDAIVNAANSTLLGGCPIGPVWQGGGGVDEMLASCYRESLGVASSVGARTIAFPAISTGAHGFPMERAARIAAAEIAAYLAGHPEIERVSIAVRGDEALRMHRAAVDGSD